MFIWTAIDVDSQLSAQKRLVEQIEKEVGFEQSNVESLPLHVSLKMSCDVSKDKEATLLADITSLLENTTPFKMKVRGIQLRSNIVWIRIKQNRRLKALHASLCDLFLNKYQIELHKFDTDFKFHTTLFLDSDEEKIKNAFERVKDMKIPATLIADTFIIGSSPTGLIGTFCDDKRIKARKVINQQTM